MSLLLIICVVIGVVHALDNGLGRTPAMGYNSWYDLQCSVSADLIKETADAYVKLGLPQLGYEYLNLDDCWAGGRYPNGTVYPDPKAFPDTLVPLIDLVHSLGLKFGVYTDRGNNTCAGRPGSNGYETLDAEAYASWGVDFLKEDSCYATGVHDEAFVEYATMRDALNKTGRPIFFDLCGWSSWYAPVGTTLGNEWRIGPDTNTWDAVLENINIDAPLAQYAGPGGWNNPCLLLGTDMNNVPRVTEVQSRAQFSMWAILAAPLMLSQNLRNLTDFRRETYTNKEVIAVDQDPLGKQGTRLVGGDLVAGSADLDNATNVWGRELFDGSWASVFINVGNSSVTVTCDEACFGLMGFDQANGVNSIQVRDLWAGQDKGTINAPFKLSENIDPEGGVMMYKFTKA